MEDCNVVVMNQGLHYDAEDDHIGRQNKHTLMDDMLAAITYLANFSSSGNCSAVWRAALPQHFASADGHFTGWKERPGLAITRNQTLARSKKLRKQNHSCSAIEKGNHQVYNKVYDDAFRRLCHNAHQLDKETKQPCDQFRHRCTVAPAAEVNYQTPYKFWRDNNIERERMRLGDSNVTGDILRWRIFDLFDVLRWHKDDFDCSHYCFVPPLFEAAFERLRLLLTPSLAEWGVR